MKIVINCTFGGFGVPDEVCDKLGCETFDDDRQIRTSKELIDWVNAHPMNDGLVVVDIPDEATDFVIHEYDGKEWIDVVVDGKIIVMEG